MFLHLRLSGPLSRRYKRHLSTLPESKVARKRSAMPFETLSADFAVQNFTAEVHEHTNPTAPTTVIATDQQWAVQIHWETTGHMSNHLPGTWHVGVWIESIGEGDEKQVGWVHVPLTPGADPVVYNAEIVVQPGAV